MRHRSPRSLRAILLSVVISLIAVGAFLLSRPLVSVESRGNTPADARAGLLAINERSSSAEFNRKFSGKEARATNDQGRKLAMTSRSASLNLLLPAITATKTDALLTDPNNDNTANPGETIRYTVTITNSGSTDALGVMFNDTPDANTTVVPGSVSTTPVAIDDSYTATGNVRISVSAPGVLGNDTDADMNTLTATAGSFTSANGGNVVMNADGSFTYNPAPGFEGSDSFNYTVNDGTGNNDGGSVSITVSGMIWFVDSSAAPGGDGRLTSPYSCLVGAGCYFPAAADDPGDNIFLYSGNYDGGLTLQANQKLIGQGAGNSLALIAGITLAPNSDPLPATGGANPVITTTLAATNGVNLGSGNLLRGFTVGNTTAIDISGSSGGSLTVREVIVNGTGRALSLSAYVLDADFAMIESTSGTGVGVTLSNVSGSLTSGSTTIQNATGIGISVSGLGTGATGVDFANTSVTGSTGTGVNLTNNTGNITFGDLDITPNNNQRALNVTNSVAVAAPGKIKSTSGSITTVNTTTAGPGAINIVGATVALRTPIDITLDSVGAINTASAPFVINVNNTTDGGFKILGSGTTSGSGGAITLAQQGAVFLNADNITLKNMNFTNANTLDGGLTCSATNVTNCKGVINLNNATSVSFDNLFIDRTAAGGGTEYGVFGRLVSGLSINASTIQNQGDGNNEGVMRFSNLSGTNAFTNSTFKFASFKVVDIVNDSGTLNLAVTGSTFSDTQTSATGSDGLSVRAQTTANVTVDVDTSSFLRLRTVGIAGVSANSATLNVDVTGSSFDPVAPGLSRAVDFASQGTSFLNFNVNSNPKIWANGGTAVNIIAVDSSAAQGRVNNNPDIRGVVTSAGSGIVTQAQNTANLKVEIIGNTISNIGNGRGIQAFSSNGTGGGARIDATITNNNVTVSAGSGSDIDVQAGNLATADVNTICANVRTNTASGASGFAFREVTGTATSTVLLDGFTVDATTTWNANLNTPLNSVTESNAGTLAGGSCNLPTNPTALNYQTKPQSNLALKAEPPAWTRIATARVTALLDESATVVQAAGREEAPLAQRIAVRKSREKKGQTASMHHVSFTRTITAAPSMAGSVSLNIGTIPAGESVTIIFDVTINSPLVPPTTTQVSNQGTVSGTNFGPVLTDDPDVGGAADPTVTPVVNPNNDPTANDDTAEVAEDSGANTILVLANDSTAPDVGETLTITAVTQGTNGSVAITGMGTTVSYTPNADYFGPDSFTYTISDGNGGSDTATVTVTVTEVNDAPTAVDDAVASIAEDSGPYTIPFATLLANDSKGPANESGQTLTITAVGSAVGGSVMISGTDVVFTPTANYNGPASFDYTVEDNGTTNGVADPKSDIGSVTFTITAVNDDPDAVDDNATVVEDSGANTINVLSNDSIAPDTGETIVITAVTQGANGSVAITGGGTSVSYTPNADYCGPDSFTYTISDGNGGTDTATVSIDVTCVNDAPVANAGPDQTANCSGPVTLDGTGTSDVDNPNSSLTFVWKEGATIIATGETANVILAPGVHTITLTVTDPGGLSSQDTVVITVVDTGGPTITLTNANITLWPPNHQYRTINLTDLVASASDACDPTVDINDVVITKVTSDETENGNGDGNTFDDIVIAANCKSVQLRAERNGSGNGRVYTVTFLVRDSSGNVTYATAKVSVPKNQNSTAVDDGPIYTEMSSCQ